MREFVVYPRYSVIHTWPRFHIVARDGRAAAEEFFREPRPQVGDLKDGGVHEISVELVSDKALGPVWHYKAVYHMGKWYHVETPFSPENK